MTVDQRLNAMVIAGQLLDDYKGAYDTWRELDELPTHPNDVEETLICERCSEAEAALDELHKRIEHLLALGIEASRTN